MNKDIINKSLSIIGAAFLTVAAISSCTLESSNAGAFDGMWHLTAVDTLSTGGAKDMGEEMIFWSFENKLMEADDKSGTHQSVLFRFKDNDGKLTLSNPYAYDRTNGDKLITDSTMLMPFGINKLQEEFQILRNKGGRLELQSATLKLSFKRM
jgi:hypothetical protein